MGISRENWETVKVLFEAALELPPSDVSAFLQKNCPNASVRAEVERLLSEYRKAGSFLSTPGLGSLHVERDHGPAQFKPEELLAGRFRIIRFIARGGMGEVYEAEDLYLGERLAVKAIRPDILQLPNAADRFTREVRLARQVTHPNVCRIFDLFRHKPEGTGGNEETLLVSMELLNGKSLSDHIRESGPTSVQEALPLIQQMAAALGAAHDVGVVHRDFKPGNVMLVASEGREDVRAVVTDFVLALRSASATTTSSWTTGNHLIGSPAYMAPELIEGHPATPASDIYALGLVIYEMVTGERPFESDTPIAMAVKRLSKRPRSPRELQPTLPHYWEAVILHCLERDPSNRFAKAQDVSRALAMGGATSLFPSGKKKSSGMLVAIGLVCVVLFAGSTLIYRLLPGMHSSGAAESRINPQGHISLSVSKPQYGPRQKVQINGVVATSQGKIVRIAWDWGDGEQESSWFPATHSYRNNGDYTVRTTAIRDDGQQTTAQTMVRISSLTAATAMSMTLPSSWISLNTIELVGNAVYLGGSGKGGGRFGVYQTESGTFSELSHLLPSSWCPVRALAYGDKQLLVGGGLRGGCLGLFSPTERTFRDMTLRMRDQNQGLYYYGGVSSVAFNGREFLIGGAGTITSLEMYSQKTDGFRYVAISPYFAVNTIVSDGDAFLIAGAGPGAGPQQPPALGWISRDGRFTNLARLLPGGWGATWRSAYDGNGFLIQGVDAITGARQLLAFFDSSRRASADVTDSFPAALQLHGMDGGNGYFLLGGQVDGKAYLARYSPGAPPTVLTRLLPEGALDVTAVRIAGSESIAAGIGQAGRTFVVSFLNETH